MVRRERWAMPVAAGLAAIGAFMLIAAFSFWIGRAPGWAFDFNAYYDAALRLLTTGTPYQAQTLTGAFQPVAEGMYLYSPVPATAFIALTVLPADLAAVVWLVLRVALLAIGCALMPVPRHIRVASFGVAALSLPVLYDLNLGNVSVVVTFLTICGWRARDTLLGGAAIALASLLRPTAAIVGLGWLVARAWRPLAGAVIAGLVLIGITLPLVGIQGWLDYVTLLRNVSDVIGLAKNVDLASTALRLGLPQSVASVAFIAGAVSAIVAVIVAARRDRELGYVVASVAGLLLVPVLWSHYLTALLIPAAYLAGRGRWWALALPLLAWLPDVFLPFVLLVAVWLPIVLDFQRRYTDTAMRGEASKRSTSADAVSPASRAS